MCRTRGTCAALAVAVLLVACGAGDDDLAPGPDTEVEEGEVDRTDPEPDTEPDMDTDPDDPPTDGPDEATEPDAPDAPDGEPGAAGDADLDARVQEAIDDLAADEGLDPSAIEVVVAEETTWPDGSLGCPEPDGMYTQALVDGYRIVLTVDDREVAYHGAVGTEPFRCDRPVTSVDPDS